MNFNKEQIDENKIKLTFDVKAEDWQQALNGSYNKNKSQYKVEGFRQGKAPKKMIENLYGKVFYDDAIDSVINQYYDEALKELAKDEIFPVVQPKFNIVKISDEEFSFTLTIVTKPKVDLGQYKDLEFKKEVKEIAQEDIDKVIEADQKRSARRITVEDKNEACKEEDIVNIDYIGSVDGIAFEGGSAEKQDLTLGSHTFIPGFEEQVVGMKTGEQKNINVKFPDDYHAELAGKDAVFAITLNKIERNEYPEIDDDFAADMGYNNLNEYKEKILNNLKMDAQSEADTKLENTMIDKIAELSNINIPEEMVEEEVQSRVEDFENRLRYQYGIAIEDYYRITGTSREEMVKQYQETAPENVKKRLVIEQIIKEEDLKVEKDEFEKELNSLKEKNPNRQMNEQDYYMIENNLLINKLFDFLKNNNKIK